MLKKGHIYRSNTDTETIIHLYEEYGIDCLERLRGMFAFAIWDDKKKYLFLARDRIGIKPLYYTYHNGMFFFASEIKALLVAPGIRRQLNEEALYHYLTFMIPPAPSTMFKDIYKIPPGQRMIIKDNGDIVLEPYWEPFSKSLINSYSENECIEIIRSIFEDSVRLRMMSDVPFGAFLSGGIDSSAVVALMAKNSNLPINTFTVGYKDAPALNEFNYAQQIAREFKTNHHEIMIDGKDMINYMPQLIHSEDEPIGDPVCVPLYYVSKLAKDNGVTVILVGEGSDELFCGYPWYIPYIREDRYYRSIEKTLPPFIIKGLYQYARCIWNYTDRGRLWLDRLDRWGNHERPFWGGAVVYRGYDKNLLLNTKYWQKNQFDSSTIPEYYYRRIEDLQPKGDILEKMAYLELKYRLPELLLMRVDKVTMSTSLEARVPFLDHKLVEFTLPISMSVKIRNQPKYLLKKTLEGIIPENIIYRSKQGFPAPVNSWFRNLPKKYIYNTIFNGSPSRIGLFNRSFLKHMLDEQYAGSRDWSVKLWTIFNFNLWYDNWIEGRESG